ncbi:MAG: threonine--tRNA ligase, partial [Silvanigrellaceae bacterium]|nr:threonine--tRNA ligase [Silvanigrellaceae bacterium]
MDKEKHLHNIRHSLAHLFAASLLEMYPQAKIAIGPPIDDGFYYDFDLDVPLKPLDLQKIEKQMKRLLPTWDKFEAIEVSAEDAKKHFADNPYKLEIIDELEKKGEKITFYKSGKFIDLCRGGHVDSPKKEIKPDAFKLHKIAGAYWRGDEKNKMLTRVYGLAFETKEELDAHILMLEEAEKRDHKKLGKELGLFVFSETVGKGLPLWTPKGSTVRRVLERFIVDEEIKRGYQHVYTTDIANLALYKKSGHYPYYKDSMYAPIMIDEQEYMLRPMTCPHHFELYLSQKHSYKEMPVRLAELAQLYRYEQSGELMGLLRVRTFCLADAHIIATRDQAEAEVDSVLDLIDYVCESLGLSLGVDYRYRLSLGDREDTGKYYKDDGAWNTAENVLRSVLKKRNAPFFEAEKEAAFYGPKIDIQMKNIHGKEETAFTVQYDFVMPKRFELKFTNAEGQEEEPVVIHRSSIGALERIFAFLIEKYAGAFPLWLSPVQVAVLPISETFNHYSEKVKKELEAKIPGLRIELDSRSESIGKKIREATKEKIPYQFIIGEKEKTAEEVSVRALDGTDLGT